MQRHNSDLLSQRIATSPSEAVRPMSGVRFDWTMAVLSAWIVIGLYIDGWSHRHVSELETFFTLWHGVFYSGYLALACFTSVAILQGVRQGAPWHQVLPIGYGMTVAGLVTFGTGGIADLLWHELFGFEKSVEALVSPSHLLIFIGLGLIVSGPLRAAWHRVHERSPLLTSPALPLLLSLTLLWSVFTFVTMFVHPFVGARAGLKNWTLLAPFGVTTLGFAMSEGMSGIVVQTTIMMGLFLIAIKRWRLRFGSMTAAFTCNVALVSLLNDQYPLILPAFLAGLGADLLLTLFQPSASRVWAYRLFASAVPVMLYAGYFICLWATEGLGWSVQMITGGIVLAGLTGWLVSYLVLPPPSHSPSSDTGNTTGQIAL